MSFLAALNAHNCNLFLAYRQELPRVLLMVLGSFLVLAFAPETYGHCTSSHPDHCVGEPVEYTGKAGENAAKDTGKTLEKATRDAGKTIGIAVRDTGLTLEIAANDSRKTLETAGQDTDKSFENAAIYVEADSVNGYGNTIEAIDAAGLFVERQILDAGKSISDAEKRIREDRVIDAFWHLGADDFKYSEENAAKATQESSLINTAGQVSASVYGGPAGAAAYAAWYTYRATGDFEMALRVGVIVGAERAASTAVKTMPAEKLTQKALLSGAIGGVAVAASGGDENALVEGFSKSGGMVLVQDGYMEYNPNDPDARQSTGDAYCMMANPELSVDPSQPNSCLPPVDAYARDANGKVLDEDGNIWSSKSGKSPDIDVRKTDYRRNHVGNWAAVKDTNWIHERGSFMTTVSRVSGMNAMAGFHDHWAVSWNMSALSNKVPIIPAVVITYMGTTAPLEKLVIDENVKRIHEQNAYISNIPVNSVLDNSDSLAVARQLKLRGIYGVNGNGGIRVAEHSCENTGLGRNIAVDKGGESTDYACRVIYDSEKGMSVLWRARNDPDYCGPKAASLLNDLLNWGWSCVSRELRIDDGHTARTYSKAPFVPKIQLSDVQEVEISGVQKAKIPDVQKIRKSDQQRSTSSVYKCSHGRFSRTIYVEHGKSNEAFACRVVYQSENETSIPWTAKNDWKNCGPIAVALAGKFEDYGWSCS